MTEQFLVELQPRYQIGEGLLLYGMGRRDRDPLAGSGRGWDGWLWDAGEGRGTIGLEGEKQ